MVYRLTLPLSKLNPHMLMKLRTIHDGNTTSELGARSGLYLLSCSKCKQTLSRDYNSDWSEVWWWSRVGDLWEYKEHDEDGGLLDLRGFTCNCSGEIETKALFWIWSRTTTEVKYFKVRIECPRGDSKYIIDQLNQLTKERGWKVTIE